MRRLTAALLGLLLLLSGCGVGSDGEFQDFAPGEDERLVVYTSHEEAVYAPVIREFEERTGVWVQVETGGAAELLDRLEAEKDAPACDLLFGGGADSLSACGGLFEPYVSPLDEKVDPSCRCADGAWTAFSLLPVVLIYNPVLVRVNPPEGWESLLDSTWRGRIAFADPLSSASSYTALSTLLQVLPEADGDAMAAFVRNLDGQLLPGSGEAVGAVANGSCTIGVALEDAALRAAEAGRDVSLVYPREGTAAIPDGMAVIAGCTHGDNARRFIDFALGEDVQRYLAENCYRRPVRMDVESPDSGDLPLIDYDLETAVREREARLARWRALEGES